MVYAMPFALAFLLILLAIYVLLRESKPRKAYAAVHTAKDNDYAVLTVHIAEKPYA